MSTIKEMREVCQHRSPNAKGKMVWKGHWFNTLFTRWFSIYITWLFVRLNITANAVTFLMLIFGLAGVPLLIPHILWLNIIGAIVLMFAEVLDCVDGEVARWNKKSSLRGCYLDLVSHALCNGIISSLCALHLYSIHKDHKYLILAFLAYFIAQSRYTLKEESNIISLQLGKPESVSKKISGTTNSHFLVFIKKTIIWTLNNFVGRISIDHILVRILAILAIFLGYFSIEWPMLVLSYYFIIAGFIGILKEVVMKFFIHIPNVEHVK